MAGAPLRVSAVVPVQPLAAVTVTAYVCAPPLGGPLMLIWGVLSPVFQLYASASGA